MSGELLTAWEAWQGSVACHHTNETWTADSLRHAAASVAHELHRSGVRPREIVGLVLANTVAFPVALVGCLQAGCTPLLLYGGIPRPELDATLAAVGGRWVMHDFVEGVSRLDGPDDRRAFQLVRHLGALPLSMRRWHAEGGRSAPPCGSEPATILHVTSGTHGRARLCDRPQRSAVAEAEDYVSTLGVFANARIVVTTPLHHAFAFGFCLVSALIAHGTLELRPVFHPWSLLRNDRPPADVLAVVPPMVPLLTRLRASSSTRAVRHAFFAGAPCDPGVVERFETAFQQPLYQIYGTTETGGISTSYSSRGRLPGTGRPLHGVRVHVRNTGHWPAIGGDVGEICVASRSLMAGYTDDAPAGEIWPTGDIGRIDETGNVFLVGRVREIINVGGSKVDPCEVERVLCEHPDVCDAAVYAGRRDDGGEFVQAAVCLERPLPLGPLRAFCGERLASYKVPQTLHVVRAIPRTPSGKCLKCHLPQAAAAESPSRETLP